MHSSISRRKKVNIIDMHLAGLACTCMSQVVVIHVYCHVYIYIGPYQAIQIVADGNFREFNSIFFLKFM